MAAHCKETGIQRNAASSMISSTPPRTGGHVLVRREFNAYKLIMQHINEHKSTNFWFPSMQVHYQCRKKKLNAISRNVRLKKLSEKKDQSQHHVLLLTDCFQLDLHCTGC